MLNPRHIPEIRASAVSDSRYAIARPVSALSRDNEKCTVMTLCTDFDLRCHPRECFPSLPYGPCAELLVSLVARHIRRRIGDTAQTATFSPMGILTGYPVARLSAGPCPVGPFDQHPEGSQSTLCLGNLYPDDLVRIELIMALTCGNEDQKKV